MSSGPKDIEVFRRFGAPRPFKEWLEQERAAQVRFLTTAVDMHTVHRAQGQIYVYDKLIALVDTAMDSR